MADLAIVVPAFKAAFLDRALGSIAAQRDPRFTLYVFDDASPEPVEAACRQALCQRSYRFRRFDANLGGADLASHWTRCVRATQEPWVWLFADDDVMDEDCVASFHRALRSSGAGADVYLLNTRLIADDDSVLRRSARLPEAESAIDFALSRLAGMRDSCVPNHVFSRACFEREGGFMSLPMAWCSDDATWISLARLTGFRTLPGGEVSWRVGSSNLSGKRGAGARCKLDAAVAYLVWLKEQIRSGRITAAPARDLTRFEQLWPRWLLGQIRSQGIVLGLHECRDLVDRLCLHLGCSASIALALTVQAVVSPQRALLVQLYRGLLDMPPRAIH